MQIFWYLVFGILGLVLGSFLNVVIYRIPRDESIVFPPSHCPVCNVPIKPYDNIPVISYIILRGRCRNCGERISIIYPLVEVITGAIFISLFIKFGWSFEFPVMLVLMIFLIPCFFIDLKFKIIPYSPLLFIIPFILRLVDSLWISNEGILFFLKQYVVGGAVGFILIVIIRFIGTKIFRKEAMGMGDAILFLFIGLFLGWKPIPYILFIASILGSIISLVLLITKQIKDKEIPFGPYIVSATVVYIFYGPSILEKFNIYQLWNDIIFIISN